MDIKSNGIVAAAGRDLIAKLISSWLFMGSVMMFFIKSDTIDAKLFQSINLAVFIVVFLFFFAAQTAVQYFLEDIKTAPVFVLMSVSLFTIEASMKVTDKFIILGFAAAVFLAAMYAYNAGLQMNISPKACKALTACAAVFFTAFLCVIMVLRVLVYTAPNFDFGIFCNIYYHLKESLQPLSTCERDKLLSHFAVHFSPVLYLLLPIYYIFPSVMTLEISQTVILLSGAVPLILLMKKYEIDSVTKMFFTIAYLAYPAINYGSIYDFHENCFILPFLLWMFFFYEKGRNIPFFIFAFFVLTVKEEAFAYVFIFAVYILVSRKDWKKGVALMIVSTVYFGLAVFCISRFGEGIMSNRFANLKLPNEGLLGVVKTVFKTPVLVFNEMFRGISSDSGKLIYFLQLFVPLTMLPFMSKKSSRLILICPVMINLLSDYYYQCDLGKQYSFGITAFLFYASVMNLAETEKKKRNYLALTSAVVGIVMMLSLMYPRIVSYSLSYSVNKSSFNRITEVLEEIPDDASVTASTFFVPKLSQRDVIYEVHYHSGADTDYLVLDLRGADENKIAEYEAPYVEAGYKMTVNDDGLIRVYSKN